MECRVVEGFPLFVASVKVVDSMLVEESVVVDIDQQGLCKWNSVSASETLGIVDHTLDKGIKVLIVEVSFRIPLQEILAFLL